MATDGIGPRIDVAMAQGVRTSQRWQALIMLNQLKEQGCVPAESETQVFESLCEECKNFELSRMVRNLSHHLNHEPNANLYYRPPF